MSNPFKIPLEKLEATINAIRPQLVHSLAVTTIKFKDDNFVKGGFQGAGFDKWPARQKKDKGKQRKLLVKNGTLRKSLDTPTEGHESVTFSSDVPYARIHNEGGDISIPARETMLHFRGQPGSMKLTKIQTENQQRRVKHVRRASIGSHTIHMPKRQFIGNSPVLTQRCQYALIKIIKEHVK